MLLGVSDAQTAVSFELKQPFSTISSNDVEVFQTLLVNDLVKQFGFPNNAFQNVQVIRTVDGRIQVESTLQIDTSNTTLVKLRNTFQNSLTSEVYSFLFNDVVYTIKGSSVIVKPSFQDYWHEYAFEVFLAIVAALAAIAIFVFAVFCYSYYMKRKNYRQDAMFEMSSRENRAYDREKDGRHYGRKKWANGRTKTKDDRMDTQSVTSVTTLATTRTGQKDTLFEKLLYANYSVPKQHMFNFL